MINMVRCVVEIAVRIKIMRTEAGLCFNNLFMKNIVGQEQWFKKKVATTQEIKI